MQCKPIFILSLDCEGKWGMADHINAYHETHFTTANIEAAYAQILAPLKEYNIPASFAFVAAFTQSVEQFKRHKDFFYNTPQSYTAWLAKFYNDMEKQNYEGWFCPAALTRVQDAGIHEVASHSCFHRPFVESELTLEEAEYDFRAAQELLAHKPETFIYPRNVVGFTPLLKKYGFIGYRSGIDYDTPSSLPESLAILRQSIFSKLDSPRIAKAIRGMTARKLLNLAAEFNIATPSETPIAEGIVPAGYFLNWPHGLRKYVPDAITQMRWKNIIKDAVKSNGVVHMWFHPHNFINHPTMRDNFVQIMRTVAEYRDSGQLNVMTMREYLCL